MTKRRNPVSYFISFFSYDGFMDRLEIKVYILILLFRFIIIVLLLTM